MATAVNKNNKRQQHRPQHRLSLPVRLLLALCCFTLLLTRVSAQEIGLEVREARTRLADGVWYVSARIDYRLSREVLDALQNGVSLTFELQAELNELRRWLPDSEVATLRQSYQLSWQPLSQGYLVRNTNTGDQQSFSTLYAALRAIGRVSDLPLIDASLLDPEGRYEVQLRALLDQEGLPGPLRLIAFWDDGFSLESEWYLCPLTS